MIEGRKEEEWVSREGVRHVPPSIPSWVPAINEQCELLYLDGWWPVKVKKVQGILDKVENPKVTAYAGALQYSVFFTPSWCSIAVYAWKPKKGGALFFPRSSRVKPRKGGALFATRSSRVKERQHCTSPDMARRTLVRCCSRTSRLPCPALVPYRCANYAAIHAGRLSLTQCRRNNLLCCKGRGSSILLTRVK